MSTLQNVVDDFAQLIPLLTQAIDLLKARSASQAQIDALDAQLQQAKTDLSAAIVAAGGTVPVSLKKK